MTSNEGRYRTQEAFKNCEEIKSIHKEASMNIMKFLSNDKNSTKLFSSTIDASNMIYSVNIYIWSHGIQSVKLYRLMTSHYASIGVTANKT
ncbi:hypothetical protein ACH3XW_24135 [Acanthocheilonema viteae]